MAEQTNFDAVSQLGEGFKGEVISRCLVGEAAGLDELPQHLQVVLVLLETSIRSR